MYYSANIAVPNLADPIGIFCFHRVAHFPKNVKCKYEVGTKTKGEQVWVNVKFYAANGKDVFAEVFCLACWLQPHSLMHSIYSTLPMIRSVILLFLVNPFMRVFSKGLWRMPEWSERSGQARGPMSSCLITLHTPASPRMEPHLRSS